MTLSIEAGIRSITSKLQHDQAPDGSWKYAFESGIATDAYMIILLMSLGIHDEKLIRELCERILSKQGRDGAWKLYEDEEDGNVSATTELYYALLYSGYYGKDDPQLAAARRFIVSRGGIEKTHMFTKIMLAVTGQYRWPAWFPLPVEMILLPHSFPVNFYDISVYGRANLAPMMILIEKKYSLRTAESPDLSELLPSGEDASWTRWDEAAAERFLFPGGVRTLAIDRLKQYMLKRIEPDGTLYNYFSATFLMIFALLALGYPKDDPIIVKAVQGLRGMQTVIDGHTHMQYTTAEVWNTSLLSFALQKAGVAPDHPMCERANRYLLGRQHYRYGDWSVHNPEGLPGGWGFEHMNTMHPDIDDTTASLRAIAPYAAADPTYRQAWDRGMQWLMTMQNNDGGWGSFEKNMNQPLLKLLPLEGGRFLLEDPSTADLTGRTLEFIGGYTRHARQDPAVLRAVNWLIRNQERDGSWYGRWGICYIYGTWAALTGLVAAGVSKNHPSVRRAVRWLESIQNTDGGWGESCRSDSRNTYVPLGASTLVHTAWAVDALAAVSDRKTKAVETGVAFLLKGLEKDDWTTEYPKGQGMAGGFYIHYHSYRYVFPLLALAQVGKLKA